MKRSFSVSIYMILMAILVLSIAAVTRRELTQMLLSIIFGAALLFGPFKIGEDIFDLIDKYCDRFSQPDEQIHWATHAVYAVIVGLILFVTWPAVAVFLIDNDHLRLYDWHQYFRLVDDSKSWFLGYPQYALYFGYVALATSIFGYIVEGIAVLVTKLAKNRMKRGA